jgi:transposase
MSILTPNQRRTVSKRAWGNEHDRPVCPCGNVMGVGVHRKGAKHCVECELEIRAVRRAMRHEQIYEVWHKGATYAEIATQLGVTPAAARGLVRRMRREGWDMPYRPRRGVASRRTMQFEHIYDAWHRGESLREIAEQVGITPSAVGSAIARMRQAGWDMPYRRVVLTQFERALIYDMWHEGELLREIAEQVGVTTTAVVSAITKMRREGWDVPYRCRRRSSDG